MGVGGAVPWKGAPLSRPAFPTLLWGLPTLALALALALALPAAVTAQETPPATRIVEPIFQEGFEKLTDGLPEGWRNATQGEMTLTPALDRRGAQEGHSSLRLQATGWEGGTARVLRPGIPLRAGVKYALELWLRARDYEGPVSVRLEGGGTSPVAYRQLVVGGAWRRCLLEFTPSANAPGSTLAISFSGSGTVWLDGIRLFEGELPPPVSGTTPPAAPMPRSGNRLYNSGFELGAAGWIGSGKQEVVATGASEGRRFLRWQPGPANGDIALRLEALPFLARPEVPYTFSVSLRSPGGFPEVEIGARELGATTAIGLRVRVTPDWRRYTFTTTLPAERSLRYLFTLTALSEAGIEVDGAQAEEGSAATDYTPAAPLEVAPVLTGDRVIEQDAETTLPIRFHAPYKPTSPIEIRYRLVGYHGESLLTGHAEVPPGTAAGEVTARFRSPALGALRFVAEGVQDGEVLSYAETSLLAVPAGSGQPHLVAPPGRYPGCYSWLGAEEACQVATEGEIRLLLARGGPFSAASGAETTQPPTFDSLGPAGKSPIEFDGSAKPVAAALLAAGRLLEGATPAGKVDTATLRAYAFRAGRDTILALWFPSPRNEVVPLEVGLEGIRTRAWDVMGNPRGLRVSPQGEVRVPARGEPLYLRAEGITPAALLAAVQKAETVRATAMKSAGNGAAKGAKPVGSE